MKETLPVDPTFAEWHRHNEKSCHACKTMFELGAQSRDAEFDRLLKRIVDLTNKLEKK